jgi:L-amino acid N-acyltransferase YncA
VVDRLRAHEARLGDAGAIAAIYNAGIAERVATFETQPRTADEVRAWFDRSCPIVVVEDDHGRVLGYASSSPYSGRECYAGIIEFSVYTDPTARHRGVGRAAMQALIAAAESRGYWKLLGGVFVENEPSRRLLASLGFREVGVHRRHGRLDGEWRDVVLLELLVGDARDG